MARTGALPHDLLAVASRFATTGLQLQTATPDERIAFTGLTRQMVAAMLRAVRGDADVWEDVRLTVEDLDRLELPPDDLRMLELVAGRQTTPAVATAAAKAMIAAREVAETLGVAELAMGDAIAAETPEVEEADATVNGWATFPGEPAGALDREDGGEVRPVPGADVSEGP